MLLLLYLNTCPSFDVHHKRLQHKRVWTERAPEHRPAARLAYLLWLLLALVHSPGRLLLLVLMLPVVLLLPATVLVPKLKSF
jgi:hypothetical protein